MRSSLRFVCRWGIVNGPLALAIIGLLIAVGAAWLLPADDAVISMMPPVASSVRTPLHEVARQLSFFGDFAGFNLTLFVVLQVLGWARRSRFLLRVAVASLLCASLSGLTANVVRFATGRPRPSTLQHDGLQGPSWSSHYQSFPSAHTATAFGGSLPVLFSLPVAGVPLTTAAAAIGWSRLQLGRHHLTDVLASMLVAMMFNLPLARWIRSRALSQRLGRSPISVPAHDLHAARKPYRKSL